MEGTMPNSFTLDRFKIGYAIVYRHEGGLFGDMIVKKQLTAGFIPAHAEYSHVEISLGEEYSINISPPKSRLCDILKVHKGRYIKIVKYRATDYNVKRYKVGCLYASLNNTGYDFRGILSFMFKWLRNKNRLYFCSEGCLTALQMVYSGAFGMNPNECMPAEFLNPKFTEVVFEGYIPK